MSTERATVEPAEPVRDSQQRVEAEVPARSHLTLTEQSARHVLEAAGVSGQRHREAPVGLKKLAKLVKKYRAPSR